MSREETFNSQSAIPCSKTSKRTMFFDANVALTDGSGEVDEKQVQTIPDLFGAVKFAVDGVKNFKQSESKADGVVAIDKDVVKVGDAAKETIVSGKNIVFEYDGCKIELSSIVDAIKELNYRTAYIDSDLRINSAAQ